MKDGFFYFILLTACIVCAIYCNMNTENESKLKLISVRQIQQTLKAADYNIKVDGKFGPETDLALTKYITKQKD